jgi:hypothetical protein
MRLRRSQSAPPPGSSGWPIDLSVLQIGFRERELIRRISLSGRREPLAVAHDGAPPGSGRTARAARAGPALPPLPPRG